MAFRFRINYNEIMFDAFTTIEKAKGLIGFIVILGLGYYAYPYDYLSVLFGAITITLIARFFWYSKKEMEVNNAIASIILEGKSRPSFFRGVTTVLAKLFNIVRPTNAFFGEKDAQQLLIVKIMVKDMAYPINIISCPIIRHNNGLAMSSRNSYLSESEKKAASIIPIAKNSKTNCHNSVHNPTPITAIPTPNTETVVIITRL